MILSIGDNNNGQHPNRLTLALGPAAARTGDTRTMTTLTIGIADTDEMKARARRIMQGEEFAAPANPRFGSARPNPSPASYPPPIVRCSAS
jgi:hypothetical protein